MERTWGAFTPSVQTAPFSSPGGFAEGGSGHRARFPSAVGDCFRNKGLCVKKKQPQAGKPQLCGREPVPFMISMNNSTHALFESTDE